MIQNLVANAIRYTTEGHVALRATARDADTVEIEVADTGPGIPRDQQRTIFEEFRRLEGSERTDERGLGLGLAIVDRLAALLGHELELESAPGAGTTFRVRVGRVADPTAAEPGPGVAGAAGLVGLGVLVVDDDTAICEAMVGLLEGWSCRAITGGDAEEAIAAWTAGGEGAPDVAVVDLSLGAGRSGLDAVAALRKRFGEHLPTLVVTGETSAEALHAVREAGLPLLSKPVPPARLRAFSAS